MTVHNAQSRNSNPPATPEQVAFITAEVRRRAVVKAFTEED